MTTTLFDNLLNKTIRVFKIMTISTNSPYCSSSVSARTMAVRLPSLRLETLHL